MITQNIRYLYLKFTIDAAGVLAAVGIPILLINNIYTDSVSNGGFEAGINISGQNMIF
ncbi:hypothetical protein [Jeotgalicoccus psychrophilus]|uniref:hypothetical protein n=1 Tax=Jeotgalicoccus psychrophilus TaxID=157228 RepID=UPI0012EB8AC3|nr:hypothetical protein [Jeotgalicoccus psychrophilus]